MLPTKLEIESKISHVAFTRADRSVNRFPYFNVVVLRVGKIRQTFVNRKNILSMAIEFNKWFFILLAVAGLNAEGNLFEKKGLLNRTAKDVHPLHVSVTEINHNAAGKTLEITCKMFTDDFEKVLVQNYKTKVDLINPPDRPAMDKLVSDFVQKHVLLKIDNKQSQLSYIGYERDSEAVYSYFQVENIAVLKKLEISNTILHELFTDQINMMHIMVGGKRKSVKLDYPDKDFAISF